MLKDYSMASSELLSISFDVLDNGLPAIIFCDQFTVAITGKQFPKNYIYYFENDAKFKLGFLSGNNIMFTWEDEEANILKVYFKKEFMGFALSGDIYNVMTKCLQTLLERHPTDDVE